MSAGASLSPPTLRGASHVAFTVTDLDASAEWYERVFGWQELRRFGPGEAGGPRIILLDPNTFFAVGLCKPEDGADERFDHRRTGLDHFALRVADMAGLEHWSAHLDANEVAHSPVRHVTGLGAFISFEDPDGIQFELWVDGG